MSQQVLASGRRQKTLNAIVSFDRGYWKGFVSMVSVVVTARKREDLIAKLIKGIPQWIFDENKSGRGRVRTQKPIYDDGYEIFDVYPSGVFRRPKVTEIEFEDHGQDFLRWTVTDGLVTSCVPFQERYWIDTEVLGQFSLHKGDKVRIKTADKKGTTTMNYPVRKVRHIK